MRKLAIVAICTCLVFLFSAGTVLGAPEITVFGVPFFYTKTCEEAQICSCNSPTDVVVSGGAVCSQGENAFLFVYLTASGPTCVIPVESGGFIGCFNRTHVPNAWFAECGQCSFSSTSGPSCSNNLFPASITITCFKGNVKSFMKERE